MGGLGAPEIILIIIAILLLFGGKKIPELMRGLGKGVKEFKDAQNGEGNTTTEEKPKV
ncbi:sec-independent protein translocase protein TatA [Mucilaginibacter sp. OK268]|jgi:sec-independent protein translocase protein TatA|uniref:twin-arginine translocase TatA/TatE family subunit n=1 Tax=Mucilaginibacter sp. OK268 TaxID=1881048 RepID=UPI00088D9126|nr:twin-arginine translocase TatA/TatE family subunit [Mucilaginibacter sp. OK268]SDP95221.1 sec-independent protein translocase protein TatA [Mucilaginibacter sp. OK268]